VNAGSRPAEDINDAESDAAVIIATVEEPLSILKEAAIKKGSSSPAPVNTMFSEIVFDIEVAFNTAAKAPPAPATISIFTERSILSAAHSVNVLPRSVLFRRERERKSQISIATAGSPRN
jgi:hypothetical protein